MKYSAFLAVLLLTSSPLLAEEPAKVVPHGNTWFAEPCETWNCATAALVLANGDGSTIALPTQDPKYKWVVLHRIPAGDTYVSPENPFRIEVMDTYLEAVARLATIDVQQSPVLLTSGASILIVTTRPAPRERAVRH